MDAAGASPDVQPARILLVAPNISRRMGGEGLKALQIHLELRAMGYAVRQVTHARVRAEIERDYPDLAIDYVEDDLVQVWLHRLGLGPLLALLNAWQLHRRARRVARSFDPWVVHFTSPISPVQPYFRFPSHPVVIGPINGNIMHPPGFRDREPRGKALTGRVLRPVQRVLGSVFRGKRAAMILVAGGERTERALIYGGCSPDRLVPSLDCGIPDALIDRPRHRQHGHNPAFVFLGRLVRYKACDLAIRAVAAADPRVTLDVIGDGPERAALERLASELGVADRVVFQGWLQPGPALYERLDRYRGLVMPTLAEANGIAFQEAMTLGIPIICVDWGGPQELLGPGDAIMIPPSGPEQVVGALAAAMTGLADDADAADAMAARARDRALAAGFRWRDLLQRWEHVYRRSAAEPRHRA
jgi:glycosyltransferase involved in cell wall biosynthesis